MTADEIIRIGHVVMANSQGLQPIFQLKKIFKVYWLVRFQIRKLWMLLTVGLAKQSMID